MEVEIKIDIDDIFNNLTWKEQEEFIEEHLDVLNVDILRDYLESIDNVKPDNRQ